MLLLDAAVLPADAEVPVSSGESPLLVEEGETGSTMARAEADEISALDDVSGREALVRIPLEVGGPERDNKNGPDAVFGLPSSLQSSRTDSRRD